MIHSAVKYTYGARTNIKKGKTRNKISLDTVCGKGNYCHETCILSIMIKIQFSEGWNKTSWKSVALLCNHYYSLPVNGTREEASTPPGSYDLSLEYENTMSPVSVPWFSVAKHYQDTTTGRRSTHLQNNFSGHTISQFLSFPASPPPPSMF